MAAKIVLFSIGYHTRFGGLGAGAASRLLRQSGASRAALAASTARADVASVHAQSAHDDGDGDDGAADDEPLYLIDALPLIYRGYYGIRGSSKAAAAFTSLTTSTGTETTAVFGFASLLGAFLAEHRPKRLAVRAARARADTRAPSPPPALRPAV